MTATPVRTAPGGARTLSWLVYSRSLLAFSSLPAAMSSSNEGDDADDLTPIEKPRGYRHQARRYVTRDEANRLLRQVEQRRAVRRLWHRCVLFLRWLRSL
jgi:hypothetical protein